MRKSDIYFHSVNAIYLIAGLLAVFTHFVPVEVVQLTWLVVLAAPLSWPRLGRAVGFRSFWGNNSQPVE